MCNEKRRVSNFYEDSDSSRRNLYLFWTIGAPLLSINKRLKQIYDSKNIIFDVIIELLKFSKKLVCITSILIY